MILFSSLEFGFVHLPEAYSTGSSAMPQKKNPDLLELARGKAGRVIGDATSAGRLERVNRWHTQDLQETQEPLFDATDTVVALLAAGYGLDEISGIQSRSHAGSGAIRVHERLGARSVTVAPIQIMDGSVQSVCDEKRRAKARPRRS